MLYPKSFTVLSAFAIIVSHLSAQNIGSDIVYSKICSVCHGKSAEGNPNIPDSPPLNRLTQDELASKLSEIKGIGFEHYHEKMEKNLKIIELRGMKYNSFEMAKYIYSNFNSESK